MRQIAGNGHRQDTTVTDFKPAAVEPFTAPPPPDSDDASGPDWSRVWSAVMRHRIAIATTTVISGLLGLVATRVVKPQFVVQSMIWIDQDPRRSGDPTLATNQSFDAAAWSDLVRSAQVLDTVVRELHLNVAFLRGSDTAISRTFALAPDFTPGRYALEVAPDAWVLSRREALFPYGPERLTPVDRGAAGKAIGERLGFRWTLPTPATARSATLKFNVFTARDAARDLGDALDVHISPEGNFLRLSLKGQDATHAAKVLDAVDRRYVAVAADLRRQKLAELTKILGARAKDAADSLRRAENDFQSHRVESITLPADAASAPVGRGGADPAALAPAAGYFGAEKERDEIARARSLLGRVASGSEADIAALDGLPAVERDAELTAALKELATKRADLRSLSFRYSDDYPPVARLKEEIDTLKGSTIPMLAGRIAGALAGRQAEVEGRVGKMATELRAMPPRAITETRLRRNVEMAEQLYTSLQQKYDAVRVADESSVNGVRILDDPVAPQLPDRNIRMRIMLIAIFGGLAASIAAAVAHDRVDPRVRYPAQLSNEMGLTVLGALPHLPSRVGRNPALDAPMVEALRGVRLNLAYAFGVAGPLTVTISSPGSADGKSFLSSNLARAFAEGGQRTVLIDGDLRRGVLHRRFAHSRRPGLADYLLGHRSLDEIIQHTAYEGLDLVPCGTRAVEAPELLGRAATAQLLGVLKSRYDVVICDSPPLTAGIDAFVLAAATGNLLLVMRAGYSHLQMTSAKLDVLCRMPVRLLGAVLNDVRDDSIYNSYSYYLPGYEATDEADVVSDRAPVLR